MYYAADSEDTIIAIATPPGEGAIGVVRISGSAAMAVATAVFRTKDERTMDCTLIPARAHHGFICRPQTGELLDEVVVTFYRSPRSYTGEDVLEISGHGGSAVLRTVIEACLSVSRESSFSGHLRLAEPGEFTLRAFLNGRIDLSQAEAVVDLIRSKSDLSVIAAVRQLTGALGDSIHDLQQNLARLMTHLEASLDFPDDELEPWSPEERIVAAQSTLEQMQLLISTYERGRLLREGINIVIAGKPNVGKSSLLNALLRKDRAIVTPVPGTTRDTLEEATVITGLPVNAIDTAGIRADPGEIESLGIDRARRAISEADLILLVLDTSQPLDEDDESLLTSFTADKAIKVLNKCDLPSAWSCSTTAEIGEIKVAEVVKTCAIDGSGIEQLEEAIVRFALGDSGCLDSEPALTRYRHKNAMERAASALSATIDAMRQNLPADIASVPLRECLLSVGEITGDNLIETAIHDIFSEFCVGK